MTFGEKLVLFRTKKGLSQKSLAELLDITPTRLNYWEKDKREPDISMVRQLAAVLDVSANVLIGLEEAEETKKSPAPEGTEDSDKIKRERSYRLFDALVSAGLIRNDDLVADDINFLFHVLDVIDDWFSRKERQ